MMQEEENRELEDEEEDLPGDGGAVLDPADLHAGARQGAQGGLRTRTGRLRAVAA